MSSSEGCHLTLVAAFCKAACRLGAPTLFSGIWVVGYASSQGRCISPLIDRQPLRVTGRDDTLSERWGALQAANGKKTRFAGMMVGSWTRRSRQAEAPDQFTTMPFVLNLRSTRSKAGNPSGPLRSRLGR